jgi:hypothetical protein
MRMNKLQLWLLWICCLTFFGLPVLAWVIVFAESRLGVPFGPVGVAAFLLLCGYCLPGYMVGGFQYFDFGPCYWPKNWVGWFITLGLYAGVSLFIAIGGGYFISRLSTRWSKLRAAGARRG